MSSLICLLMIKRRCVTHLAHVTYPSSKLRHDFEIQSLNLWQVPILRGVPRKGGKEMGGLHAFTSNAELINGCVQTHI